MNEETGPQDWRGRKGLLALLTLVALAVWAGVVFRATGGFQEEGSSAPVRETVSGVNPIRQPAPFTYRGEARDIFEPPPPSRRDCTSVSPPAEIKRTPSGLPPLRQRLVGLVDGTALLSDSGGTTAFVQEGDVFQRYTVTAIEADYVILTAAGRADTLRIRTRAPETLEFK